jgi:malonate transporter
VLYRVLDVGDPFWSGLEKLVYFVLLAVKLLLVPAVTLLAASSLGLRGVYFDTAVLFGALPTATSAYIQAVRMGGDGPGVAWLISANTLAAMLTLSV